MQSLIEQFVLFAIDVACWWFCFLEETSAVSLALLAAVFRVAAATVFDRYSSNLPRFVAGPLMLGYFLVCFTQHGDDVSYLFAAVMRTALAYQLAWSASALALVGGRLAMRPIFRFARAVDRTAVDAERTLCERCRAIAKWCFGRRVPPPMPQLPSPPLPRAVRLQRLAAAAQADFEIEVQTLSALPLDEDEREVLTLQAKQRLLQKLSQLPSA